MMADRSPLRRIHFDDSVHQSSLPKSAASPSMLTALTTLTVFMLLIAARPAAAHHAFAAEFDSNAPVLLRGKVTRVEWINPHGWVHMMVDEPGKPAQVWAVEGGTPNTLLRAGITRETLKIGTEIVVRGYQSKDRSCTPTCKANGRDMTFENGEKVFMGSSGTGAPRDGSDPTESGKRSP